MLELYIKLVKSGWREIENIPPSYQEKVKEALKDDGTDVKNI